MLSDVKSILIRSRATLVQDMAGMAALAVLLMAGLHIPSLL